MSTDTELRVGLVAELVKLREFGILRLDELTPSGRPKLPATLLETAARHHLGDASGLTRSAAVATLLRDKIALLGDPGHREWLPISLGVKEGLPTTKPHELNKIAAEKAGHIDPDDFKRTGRKLQRAFQVLAAQIVADCFSAKAQPVDDPPPPTQEEPAPVDPGTSEPVGEQTQPEPSPAHGNLSTPVPQLGRRRVATNKDFWGRLGIRTFRSQTAAMLRFMAEIDQTISDTPELATLAKNDEYLAIVALSGGKKRGASEASLEIRQRYGGVIVALPFMDGKRGKRNAAAALKLLAQNQSRAIPPGGSGMIQRGIDRLTNEAGLRRSLGKMFQELSRANGRIDLGGNWSHRTIVRTMWAASYRVEAQIRQAGGDHEARRTESERIRDIVRGDLTTIAGIALSRVIDLVRGHPYQILALIGEWQENDDGTLTQIDEGALHRMLTWGGDDYYKTAAALIMLEMHSVLNRAHELSRDLINFFFEQRQLDPGRPDFADQVALHTGTNLSGEELKRMIRQPDAKPLHVTDDYEYARDLLL